MKNKCPCCGYITLDSEDEYEICPVCFWEKDPVQEDDPGYSGGANKVSLTEARKNFSEIGACDERFAGFVREPLEDEIDKEQ